MTTTLLQPGDQLTEDDIANGLRVTNTLVDGQNGTITVDPNTEDVFQEGDELGWDEGFGPISVNVAWDNSFTGYTTIDALRVADDAVFDANGNPVTIDPEMDPEVARIFFATRVPAAECDHYIAKSEANSGFTKCERC